ncbi:hypothetical protein ACQEVB_12340 [Pseudonocardia sp. CA-107938]|uniref:hypothetical protein n=1 Tax=Pseudonocardia sp. CA-107938 TaxID=3240021 RepID=UPI003D92192B
MTTDERPSAATANTVGLFALGLGIVGLISSWTGWGGLVLGLLAIVCTVVALWLARHGGARRVQAIVGGVLGVAALVIGLVIEWDTLFGTDESHFGVGLTLDQCMAQADTAKLQHLCKTQHLDEFMKRYPDSDE